MTSFQSPIISLPSMIRANTLKSCTLSFAVSAVFFLTLLFPSTLHAQCNPDITPPIARCRNTTIYLDTTGQVGLNPLQVNNGSVDNCNEWYLILDHPCFFCSDIGNKNVILYVQDKAGNKSNCTSVVTIRDTTRPKLAVKTTFSVNLAGGAATVTAQQLVASASDNCSALNKIQFAIRKIGAGTGFPTTSTLTFACADTGKQNVEIWARDSTGNAVSRTTSFQVSDPNRTCAPVTPIFPSIIGNIRTETGKAIAAQVTLSGGNAPSPTVVKTSDYNFSNLLRGGNFTVTAFRDTDWINGVTTYDIALMSQHALDIVPFNTPYKLIAGDVDKDGTIDATDMLLTRKLVLRQINSIAGNTSWRFIPKSTVLPSAPSPPPTNLPELMTFTNVMDTIRNADFIAVKTGDVNTSAQNLASNLVQVRNAGLKLGIDDRQLEWGKTYDLEVLADAADLVAFQFTLNFNKNIVKILNIQSIDLQGFNTSNYAIFNDKGLATVSWNGQNLNNLNQSKFFKVTIHAEQNIKLSDALLLTSDLTKAEAYNISGDPSNVQLHFNRGINTAEEFALLPNVPNPFSKETMIRFTLPSESDVQLRIFDETGRVLKVINRSFSKGYNELPLVLDDPSVKTSGIIFYQLKTATHSATQRMVILK